MCLNFGIKISDNEVKEMMRDADVDHDGTISFEEFTRILKKSENFKLSEGWRLAQQRIVNEIEDTISGGLLDKRVRRKVSL